MHSAVGVSVRDASVIKDLRETFSLGLLQVRKIHELFDDGTCPDLLHAVYWEHSAALAVHVKGGSDSRLRWNLEMASSLVETALQRDPSLKRFSIPSLSGRPASDQK